MTPRERVRKTLDRQPVDRMPNGLGGCETTGLHIVAYDRLKRLLGIRDPKNRMATFMANAIVEPRVLRAMDGDIVLLGTRMCPSRFWGAEAEKEWKPTRMWDVGMQVAEDWDIRQETDGAWVWNDLRCPAGSYYFDRPPSSAAGTVGPTAALPCPAQYHPPHEISEPLLARLAEDARWLWQNTEFAIACGEMITDLQIKPGGPQAWWMRMIEDPKACDEFLDKAVDTAIEQITQLDQAIGKYCAMMVIADDMGDARGTMIGPDLWRQIYRPHYKRLFREWHKRTAMKVCLHSCASMVDVIDDLVDCGVDVYNPVQVSPQGMDAARLKERFGSRVVLYGGAYAPANHRGMNEDQVYEALRKTLATLNRGGGYLFAGTHNLPADMPPGHLRALLRAYQDSSHDRGTASDG